MSDRNIRNVPDIAHGLRNTLGVAGWDVDPRRGDLPALRSRLLSGRSQALAHCNACAQLGVVAWRDHI